VKAQDRGFKQGYRDEIMECDLDWLGVSKRWRKGYAAGRAAAKEDLDWRYMWSRRDPGHVCKACGLYPDGTDSRSAPATPTETK
jgi:hypothetical protein